MGNLKLLPYIVLLRENRILLGHFEMRIVELGYLRITPLTLDTYGYLGTTPEITRYLWDPRDIAGYHQKPGYLGISRDTT